MAILVLLHDSIYYYAVNLPSIWRMTFVMRCSRGRALCQSWLISWERISSYCHIYKNSGIVTSQHNVLPSPSFPKDKDVVKEWIKRIPRENLIVTKHTRVCIQHFEDKGICRYDVFPVADGGSPIKVSIFNSI